MSDKPEPNPIAPSDATWTEVKSVSDRNAPQLRRGILGKGGSLMDPNACYRRWSVACADGDMDEASEAWRDLAGWIRNGGFPPDWTERQAAAFRDWAPTIAPHSERECALPSCSVSLAGKKVWSAGPTEDGPSPEFCSAEHYERFEWDK